MCNISDVKFLLTQQFNKMYDIFANVDACHTKRKSFRGQVLYLNLEKARNPIAPQRRNDSKRKVQYYSLSRSFCVFLRVASIFDLCFSCLPSLKQLK